MLKLWAEGRDAKGINFDDSGGGMFDGLTHLERKVEIAILFDRPSRVLNYMGGGRMDYRTCRTFRGGWFRWKNNKAAEDKRKAREVEELLR